MNLDIIKLKNKYLFYRMNRINRYVKTQLLIQLKIKNDIKVNIEIM